MIRYKKMIAFFIIGVLLVGSCAIYTILSDTQADVQKNTLKDNKSTVKKTKQKLSMSENESVAEQIDSLINAYLNAKLGDDISEISKYVNDSRYIDEEKILRQNQYIESYDNIKCTIKQCKKNTYRVYVYYDIKVFEVEQQLPSLDAYYVVKEKDGNYKIYFGKIDSSVQKQIDTMDKSDEITALKDSVQKKMKDFISKDEQVGTLLDELKNGD